MARQVRKKKTRRNKIVIVYSLYAVMVLSIFVGWWGEKFTSNNVNRDFKVEVLNGTGKSNLALETAVRLRKLGVDVLLINNAESFDFSETLILDRKNNPDLVNEFARQIGNPRVLKQFQPQSMVDITLILGNDINKLEIGEKR